MTQANAERPGRPRPHPRSITVVDVQQLSPRMRRVSFHGADLATFSWSGPAAHIKIIFPEPGRGLDTVAMPEPDGPRPPTVRTYTPRRFDADALTLDVDFVVHGHGPASTWAAQAHAGQQLVMMGPGPGYAIDPDAAWYVLAGDAVAIPAIETILAGLPDTTSATVLLEVGGTDEARALAGPAHADVRWLAPGAGESPVPGDLLQAAIAGFAWPDTPGRVYIGCESTAMRSLRQAVIDRSGLDRGRVVARGYWRVGAANHPDRDYADD
jgi:NADPH-dependent ferric siderophore reductase